MNKIAKYRDNRIPGKWVLTDFTMEQVEGRLEFLEDEKRRRVYYQDIVYAVCVSLERALGMHDKIIVGTIDEPSTETQAKIKELSKLKLMQEAEINDLRACIKCEKMPEGYDVNDDATTELAVELAKSQLETSCMVEDAIHKADILRVATKALQYIRDTCISSPYWYNQISHAPARFQNVTRTLLRHHKIVTDAQKEIENKTRAILET